MLMLLKKMQDRIVRSISTLIMAAVLLQFALGLANVYFYLPIQVAVAHNAGAATLILLMTALLALLNPAMSRDRKV